MDTTTIPVNIEPLSSGSNPNKRRKKSIVWDHFTVESVGDGCSRAYCIHCRKSFAYISGSKSSGTSHLKRHIALGICPMGRQNNQDANQITPYTPPTNLGGSETEPPPKRRYKKTQNDVPSFNPVLSGFDQDLCSNEIAKMIIQHEYPLHIVEHLGFIEFVHSLQPQFNMVSFDSIQRDCVAIYLREKRSLFNILGEIPGRVSLTLDMWASNQTLGYMVVTGQFVDSDWRLHRRVLNVVPLSFPDSDTAYPLAVVASLSDWNLEEKLFTLALDQSSHKETTMRNLRGLLSIKNPRVLNGQLLIGSCYARLLSRLAQDLLAEMSEIVKKVRECIKYVKISDAHEEKFMEMKHHLQVPSTKSLLIDDRTKWDTTYHMLVAACELKEVFSCLDSTDPDYKSIPSVEEWREIETLCVYLKLLFEAANILTSLICPTTNRFFHDVSKIQLELMNASTSENPLISRLTKPLYEKFDKYWRDCGLVLAIAVVMDPRFKMKLVEFSFSKIYGGDDQRWIKMVEEGVHELFLEYLMRCCENGNTSIVVKTEVVDGEDTLLGMNDGLSDFDVYVSEVSSSQQEKSELDQYLDESLLPRVQDFDVLGWWRINKMKYPTLSKMACDVLSVPVSTVGPDCVFDTASKTIDGYRSSLRPVTLEALICAKDWLQYESLEFTDPLLKVEFF